MIIRAMLEWGDGYRPSSVGQPVKPGGHDDGSEAHKGPTDESTAARKYDAGTTLLERAADPTV